jgi:hypothetical protein
MDGLYLGDGLLETRDLMAQEGRRVVDTARDRGVVLRLLGGFAVHEHCGGLAACRRDHLDLDFVGLRHQIRPVVEVFEQLGYKERIHVRQATQAAQAQFVRDCVHDGDGARRAHAEDHVDVFFDRFKLDHSVDLRRRLGLHPYAVPLSDALLTKLQMHAPEPRDVRDALLLLAVAGAEGDGPGDLDLAYVGGLCARDWGLFYDVALNLQRCAEALDEAGLSDGERGRVAGLLARLTGAIDAAPKAVAWRLRAGVGTRRRWWDVVEEQGR